MSHPLLFQLNTRCWLRAWSGLLGRPVTLATVPESEFALWKQRGVTHIWLMGVWTIGPKTRDLARAQPDLRALSAKAFGQDGEEKLTGSPFAVEDFTVAKELGGDAALRQFRARLHGYGMGLVLDFIPNHLGLDHRWLVEQNKLFVRSETQRPETFPTAHAGGRSWVAHGKDPNWPAWSDTAQLDYRRADTRAAMTEVLQSIAARCDGVRCDTAMLLLNDVFDKTWAHFPADPPAPAEEFWAEAIVAVKQRHPHFVFIAEAYWDLEPRLQALGFDYSYDKKFFEHLTGRDYPALQKHVRAVSSSFNPVRFLENHDEARIASMLTVPEQKAAAALLLTQPGLRMLHDGQLAGKTHRTPVQFADYWPEHGNAETAEFYDHLLGFLAQTSVGQGEMQYCETGLAHCFAMKWKKNGGLFHLAAVNLAPKRAEFQIDDVSAACEMRHIYSGGHSTWAGQSEALHISLDACGFALLEGKPVRAQ
jgi:hypothetical protein